ncbi:hypothetical protein HAX54_001753 [Datura stramonium]|uniref:Kinesin motor domain-containing protein n=1 Tax=Datura stramonium TaxID=4076 RepID=A0ABS8RSY6_DATST|nr:hypothetical protein [Datura stramonium]
MMQNTIVDQQQRDIKDLKQTLLTTKAGMQFMQMKFREEMQNIVLEEENRRLYNEVQDLKDDGSITIGVPSKNGKGRKSFNFNKVFGPSATQGEVFSDTQQLIRSVLDGYNVCIFAYGQTGSGKTYTMNKAEGVNYRALGDLFLLAEQRKDTFLYDVSVQMIEIYNEQVRDLLVSDERVSTVELGAARVNRHYRCQRAQKEQSSPFQSNLQGREMLGDSNIQRRPMEDVGNREVSSHSAFRQKRQSFDLDELLGNSSP